MIVDHTSRAIHICNHILHYWYFWAPIPTKQPLRPRIKKLGVPLKQPCYEPLITNKKNHTLITIFKCCKILINNPKLLQISHKSISATAYTSLQIGHP